MQVYVDATWQEAGRDKSRLQTACEGIAIALEPVVQRLWEAGWEDWESRGERWDKHYQLAGPGPVSALVPHLMPAVPHHCCKAFMLPQVVIWLCWCWLWPLGSSKTEIINGTSLLCAASSSGYWPEPPSEPSPWEKVWITANQEQKKNCMITQSCHPQSGQQILIQFLLVFFPMEN